MVDVLEKEDDVGGGLSTASSLDKEDAVVGR